MAKHRGKAPLHKNTNKISQDPVEYLLEVGTLKSMRNAQKITTERIKYCWDHYAELAHQRSAIQDQLQKALIQTCIPYEAARWQRATKYKYSLHPLSTNGSLRFIGGRFNTGRDVNTEVPTFPGLYLAQDKDTALQEHLGQQPVSPGCTLTPREIALTNTDSEAIISVSAKLDKIFDLTTIDNLAPFVDLIKNFKLSSALVKEGERLQVKSSGIIKTVKQLEKTLLDPDWRKYPSCYDIPANSQVFGYLAYLSGIEGILYPSKLTEKPCLVLFPRNFANTDSYIKLDDETPHPKIPTHVDNTNWRITELDIQEIISDLE